MNQDHVTTVAVTDPSDGCARGERGTYSANDRIDTPALTPTPLRFL